MKLHLNESLFEDANFSKSVLGDKLIIQDLFNKLKSKLKNVPGVTIFPDKDPKYPYGMGNNYFWYRPEGGNTDYASLGAEIKVCYGKIDGDDAPEGSIKSDEETSDLLNRCVNHVEELILNVYSDAKIKIDEYCGKIKFIVERRGKVAPAPSSDRSILRKLKRLSGEKFVMAFNQWHDQWLEGEETGDSPLFLNTPENLAKLQDEYKYPYLDDGETWEESGYMDYYNSSDEFFSWANHDGFMSSSKDDVISYVKSELDSV